MKFLLLFLTTALITIESDGQLAPPPEALPPLHGLIVSSQTNGLITPPRIKTFSVSHCPYCGGHWTGLIAQKITTNGQYAVTNGIRIERIVTMKCPAIECQQNIDAKNDIVVPLPIATEDAPSSSIKSLAPVVLPDTNAPTATINDIRNSDIHDFTNLVNCSYRIGHFSYWHAQLGLMTKMFEVTFPVKSNYFYCAFHTDDLNHAWTEFPTDQSLKPARSDGTNNLVFPINPGQHFYTVRARISNGWTYQ